jgi:membrane-associated phospholipid phosphatase
MVTDSRQLPSRDTITWLTIGALAASLDHRADADTSRALSRSDGLGRVLDSGGRIGGARFQLGGALATYAIGRIAGKPVMADVGADLVRANILAQTLTASIKLSVRRTRPDGTSYSFPSGHTTVSFATATVLQRRFGWKVGVPAYAVGSYIAASRVQDKRHFLSDVTFGAALGIVAGHTVTIGRGSHRFAIAPAPVPGGAAIGVTLVGRR